MSGTPSSNKIEKYNIRINRTLIVEEIITGLKQRLDWVDSNIAKDNFPIKIVGSSPYQTEETGPEEEMSVVHFDRSMTTDQILSELDALDLRPATLEELAAFEEAQPELQRQYSILALGSQWCDPDGKVNVPDLCEGDDGRELRLDWVGPLAQWLPDDHFLALRK